MTLIDTAPVYGFGRSEEIVGKALEGSLRHKVTIATKVGLAWKDGAVYRDSRPARVQMTYQLLDEMAANTARLADFRRSDLPLLLIWGKADHYLHVSVAEYLRSQAKYAAIHALDAGHWPQIDEPTDTARIMLASQWS